MINRYTHVWSCTMLLFFSFQMESFVVVCFTTTCVLIRFFYFIMLHFFAFAFAFAIRHIGMRSNAKKIFTTLLVFFFLSSNKSVHCMTTITKRLSVFSFCKFQ